MVQGEVHGPWGGVCMVWGVSALGGTWFGGLSALGVVAHGSGGWCMVLGGAWSLGGLVETPPTATAADGTHPTGMHSCSYIQFTRNLPSSILAKTTCLTSKGRNSTFTSKCSKMVDSIRVRFSKVISSISISKYVEKSGLSRIMVVSSFASGTIIKTTVEIARN